MKILHLIFVSIFSLLLLSSISSASGVITLSPDGGHSNQNQINEALKNGDVYLNSGVYEIDGPIYTYPSRKLTLDPNAIIRVWKGSSQFFTGRTGLINCVGSPKDIEISGGEIDGNCDELPSNYHSNDQDPHDCERAIFLIGSSGDYGENIYIHNIKIYDTFSDGIHVRFCNKVKIANVFESNCEHEGIYFCVVLDGLIYNCEIAGITSDNLRIENSKRIKVDKGLLYSYTGDHNNGAYKGGEAGIQIGDQGRSFGVGSDKPVHTSDIEVCNTIFANNGRTAVALDIAGKDPSDNVYFHDNKFIGASELETMGIPVEGFDFGNMPTKEMSEKIFSSIFDIFDVEFTETGNVKQENVSVANPDWETKGKAEAYIYLAGYNGQISYNNETYIPKPASECAIILSDIKNLAERPTGQTSTLTLEDLDNNSLRATLEVETKYKVKDSKSITVEGVSINVPSYKEKSVNETFVKTFSVPKVFPVMSPDDVNVTVDYQNNSLNPHTTVTVEAKDGTEGVITGASYEYNGSEAREYRFIGYLNQDKTGIKTANFKETKTWKFSDDKMSYGYQSLYIKGPFDPAKLHVTVTTPYDEFEVTKFNYKEAGDPFNRKFNPTSFVIALVLFVIIRPFIFDIRNTFGRLR